MEILYTILIIIGALLLAPLAAFMFIAIVGGSILGGILAVIVALTGFVELTYSVFLTCIISGIVIAILIGVGNMFAQNSEKTVAKD